MRLISAITALLMTAPLAAQPGMLDSTFDSDGVATAGFGTGTIDHGFSVVIQADGKIVVGGYSSNSGAEDFAVARFNSSGSLDNSFSGDGKVTTDQGTNFDRIHELAIQPDGKIVAAGYEDIVSNRAFSLARYNADGALDNGFDSDGKVRVPVGGFWSAANAVAIQSDGKIVAGGLSGNTTSSFFALIRLNADGSLDNTFGSNGKVQTAVGSFYDGIEGIAIQPDGKIVAVGYTLVSDYNTALARYKPNGTLDSTFGTNGVAVFPLGVDEDRGLAVALQADGKIVIAGFAINATYKEFMVARFNSNGTPDLTFSGDGKAYVDVGTDNDVANGISIRSDGRIVLVGDSKVTNTDFGMARFYPDGSPDVEFSGDGKVSLDVSGSHDGAAAVVHQGDDKVVVAGHGIANFEEKFHVVRLMGNWGVGVLEFSEQAALFIAPNPIGSSANLSYSLLRDEVISIELYDMSGRWLKTFLSGKPCPAGEHRQALQFPDTLPSGQYLITITSGSGKVSVQVIKE